MLSFRSYARLIHHEAMAVLPELRARKVDERTIIWTHRSDVVTLTDAGDVRWMKYAHAVPGPTMSATYDGLGTAASAHVAAMNLIVFFDAGAGQQFGALGKSTT